MINSSEAIKPKNVDVDENLWLKAKIAAIQQKTSLKDWLAEAIEEKLTRTPSQQ